MIMSRHDNILQKGLQNNLNAIDHKSIKCYICIKSMALELTVN